MSYAAAYPNDLQKLILVDVFGILHRTALTGYVVQIKSRQWRSGLLTRLSIRPVHDLNDFLQSMLDSLEFQRATAELETAVNSPAFRKLVLGSDSKKIAALALVLEDYSQVLERVTTPAFILWGDKDPVAPLRTGKVLAAQLPNAQLEIIPESGHIPMLEQKEKFNQFIAQLLIGTIIVFVLLTISGCSALNQSPIILGLTTTSEQVNPLGTATISCEARDQDRDEVTYIWTATGGTISGIGPEVNWIAPDKSGDYNIMVTVSDDKGGKTTRQISINVLAANNLPPMVGI